MSPYWESRHNFGYYQIVKEYLTQLGALSSILDVGCYTTPAVTWGAFEKRYSVDPRKRPELPNVTAVVGKWPDCKNQIPKVDVVMCLQVIEHLNNPKLFIDALFEHAIIAVIISVPWGWCAGHCKQHVQDPVDDDKMRQWIPREPTEKRIAAAQAPRAVFLYKQGPSQ